ncbi:MAG: hypothetical protein ISR65_02730 [Bacteriovoracaceae bacterium]|nr:hypothetical protein [Bacteriovoracaceae bacterium]
MKTMIYICIAATICLSSSAFCEEKIIYKYKKYERFDLGNLQIKGKIIAPGDLSIKDRKHMKLRRKLYEKDNFNKECITDVRNVR